MSSFEVNNYNISINDSKNSLKVIAYDIKRAITFTTMSIDKCNDTYGSTNCDNNVSLSLDMELYDFLNNCLEGTEHYSININSVNIDEEEFLTINFIFVLVLIKKIL
jgi:hypothetical protein